MKIGFVLNFDNKKFQQFFIDTVSINIYDKKYNITGDSKAKRLRAFWDLEPKRVVGKIIKELLEVWLYHNQSDVNNKNYLACCRIRDRLLGENFSSVTQKQHTTDKPNNNRVFIVHGHDCQIKSAVSDFIKTQNLEPVILDTQRNSGKTVIEKLEKNSNVKLAVVLYTPCDQGAKKAQDSFLPRARQNVLFEHGYFVGKLGRENVVFMVKGDVEIPSDLAGTVYVKMDNESEWRNKLKNELSNRVRIE